MLPRPVSGAFHAERVLGPLLLRPRYSGCTSPPAVAAGFEPSDRQSPLTSRPLGQKVEFLGLIDALSTGSKGNISTIDFSDDVPGAEFILTPPPAVGEDVAEQQALG